MESPSSVGMVVEMLSQQVLAVVVAVGGADGGVNVIAGRLAGPVERDGALVVELRTTGLWIR